MIQIENLLVFFVQDLDSSILKSDCQILAIWLVLQIENFMTKVNLLNVLHFLTVPDNNGFIIWSRGQVLAVIGIFQTINSRFMICHLFNHGLIREIPKNDGTIFRYRSKSHTTRRLSYLPNITIMPVQCVLWFKTSSVIEQDVTTIVLCCYHELVVIWE